MLDAARRAFSSQGYARATMRNIAADARLSAMALYNYAPSKAALFALVWRESVEMIYADYAEVVAGRGSLVEEVEALLDRSREVLVGDPDHVRFVVRLLLDREQPELAGTELEVAAATNFFRELAERSVARGEIARGDRAPLVSVITTLLFGLTTVAALDPASVDAAIDAAKWAARHQLDRLPLE